MTDRNDRIAPLEVDTYSVWKPLLIVKDLWSAITDSAKTREGKGKEEDRSEKALVLIAMNVSAYHLRAIEEPESAEP